MKFLHFIIPNFKFFSNFLNTVFFQLRIGALVPAVPEMLRKWP